MRILLTLACLWLIGAAPPTVHAQSGAVANATPASAQSLPPAAARATIAVIGDSLGDGLWEGLYRYLRTDKRFTVARGAKHSVGFTGSDMTEQIDQAFSHGPVDAMMIVIGTNDDGRSFFVNGKSVALFGTPKWVDLYRKRVENFMERATKRGVPIVWVLLPVMRSTESTKSVRIINDVIAEAAEGKQLISLMSIWILTADENGAYMPYFNDISGKKRLMRHADGTHFTEPGYEVLAQMAFQNLQQASPRFKSMMTDPAVQAVR